MPAYGIADSACKISPGYALLLFLGLIQILAAVYELSYLSIWPVTRVRAIHWDLVPVERYGELDRRQARQGYDPAQQIQQLPHLALHGGARRGQLMSPLTGPPRRVGCAVILGCDGLDLLHNFDRSSETQYVTSACARDFPSLEPVTPWIGIERSETDGPGHSILDMHVPMRSAHTGLSRSRRRVVTHRTGHPGCACARVTY